MVKSAWAMGLLVAAVLSGCAQPNSPASSPQDVPDVFNEVEVTDTTGAIRGIVVNEAIVPIQDVLVTLSGGANATSDADGAFIFSGLEPGDYFLTASKLGYFDVQGSAVVVAGDKDPPITKLTMLADVANQPFTELLQWTGFFGCGTGTNAGGGIGFNPCAVDATACQFADVCLLNTANTHTFAFGAAGRIPDFAQAEMSWEGTQPLGNALNLGWHDSGTSDFKSTSGESPLILPTNRTEILEAHEEDIESLLVRVFPGTGQELTVTLQQRFDVYVTYFYGFEPREGWAFVTDGACLAPQDCS